MLTRLNLQIGRLGTAGLAQDGSFVPFYNPPAKADRDATGGPVVLPTKYEFVINLKAAKVLGSLFRARYTRPPPS